MQLVHLYLLLCLWVVEKNITYKYHLINKKNVLKKKYAANIKN